jgi:hypothetical protein
VTVGSCSPTVQHEKKRDARGSAKTAVVYSMAERFRRTKKENSIRGCRPGVVRRTCPRDAAREALGERKKEQAARAWASITGRAERFKMPKRAS